MPRRQVSNAIPMSGFGCKYILRSDYSCLFSSLAYAELFPTLAILVRCFTFELYETDVSDVEIKHDFMVPQPKLSSKGVRVKVNSVSKRFSSCL